MGREETREENSRANQSKKSNAHAYASIQTDHPDIVIFNFRHQLTKKKFWTAARDGFPLDLLLREEGTKEMVLPKTFCKKRSKERSNLPHEFSLSSRAISLALETKKRISHVTDAERRATTTQRWVRLFAGRKRLAYFL